MNVLVTGGAGYIGCVLVRQLLERGHEVTVLDRLFWGRDPLAGLNCEKPLNGVIAGDIRDWKDEWLDGIDAVAHLAGLSNDPTSEYRPNANWAMNAIASDVIAAACQQRGIERITFASSASIYDRGETHDTPPLCYEEEQVEPRGDYSQSKHHAEIAMLAAGATVLRQGTVFGYSPRMRFDLCVNTFIRDILLGRPLMLHGGGMVWRPLVDVEDVARAHVAVLEAPVGMVRGEVFDVVWDNLRVKELAVMLRSVFALEYDRTVRIEKSEDGPKIVRNYRVSGEKFRRVLDFEFKGCIEKYVRAFMARYAMGDVCWSSAEEMLHPRFYNISWMTILDEIFHEQKAYGRIY